MVERALHSQGFHTWRFYSESSERTGVLWSSGEQGGGDDERYHRKAASTERQAEEGTVLRGERVGRRRIPVSEAEGQMESHVFVIVPDRSRHTVLKIFEDGHTGLVLVVLVTLLCSLLGSSAICIAVYSSCLTHAISRLSCIFTRLSVRSCIPGEERWSNHANIRKKNLLMRHSSY